MKKIYLMGLAFSLFASSCSDVLDKDPSSELPTSEAISTIDDLANAVNGVYQLQTTEVGSYAAEFTLYADLKGGDFKSVSDVNHAGLMYRYQMEQHDKLPYDFYNVFYTSLARVNNVLQASESIDGSENLRGELYAMRALYHFDLARLYAKLPTPTNMDGLGIVLSTEVYPTTHIGERATLQKTYKTILDDLNLAIDGLLSKEKNLGHMNYWAALGLRARVNLYLGNCGDALNDCKEIIKDSPYKLYERDEYLSVWDKEDTNEALFEIQVTSKYNAQRNSIGYFTHSGGYGECAITDAFKAELANHPNDIRTKLFAEEGAPYGGVYPQKYTGRDGQIYVNNPKILRLSEIYLIAAEAALKNNDSSAAGYINTLRSKRIEGYTDVASVTIDDILLERRLELFTEGHGAWDAWRNGKSVNNGFVGEVAPDDYRTVIAIPIDEITVSQGKLIQNEGYDK